jgi:predicted deacylase
VVRLGAKVEKDQVLCHIGDPFGDNETTVTSPAAGIVIGQTTKPMANLGEALFHIALFDAPDLVAERIRGMRQDFDAEPDE